jgi:hypothetical protein
MDFSLFDRKLNVEIDGPEHRAERAVVALMPHVTRSSPSRLDDRADHERRSRC